jgi:hypothetical protein
MEWSRKKGTEMFVASSSPELVDDEPEVPMWNPCSKCLLASCLFLQDWTWIVLFSLSIEIILLPCEFSHYFWQMGSFSVDLQWRAGILRELGWRFEFCPFMESCPQ